jgi:ribosome-binding protein aMBF1 (putative translation factor)
MMDGNNDCEECDSEPAIYTVEVDGENMALCKGCAGWHINHDLVAPAVSSLVGSPDPKVGE